jgi:hypothetical protein
MKLRNTRTHEESSVDITTGPTGIFRTDVTILTELSDFFFLVKKGPAADAMGRIAA